MTYLYWSIDSQVLVSTYDLLAKVFLAPEDMDKAREEIARAVLGNITIEAGKVREIEVRDKALEQELVEAKGKLSAAQEENQGMVAKLKTAEGRVKELQLNM